MKTKEIKLTSKEIELAIDPNNGGCITSFLYNVAPNKTVNVLRPTDDSKLKKEGALASSGYVAIPYSNEIREGSFIYWGIKRKVAENSDGSIDGDGWRKAWHVEKTTDDSVELIYKHKGEEGFPYPYTAHQYISVKNNTVTIKVTITNDFELPMPVGCGFHPFFPKTDDVEIQCRNRNVWAHEGLLSINKPYKTPEDWRFEESNALGKNELDTCFGGFDGDIAIKYPKQGFKVELRSEEDFLHVFIYNRNNDDYFCVSPSTNAQDAFNLAARGVIGSGIGTLEPEETLEETFTFTIKKD